MTGACDWNGALGALATTALLVRSTFTPELECELRLDDLKQELKAHVRALLSNQ
jgi:hypothetical protein